MGTQSVIYLFRGNKASVTMLKLVVAALLATTAFGQWPQGQAPQDPSCDRYAVAGGNNIMPHPVYCQIFYSCDANGNKFTTSCPNYDGASFFSRNGVTTVGNSALSFASLFAFGEGIGTCVYTGLGGTGKNLCPYWSSTQQDVLVSRKYPDVCCNRYWQVVAVGKFEQKKCGLNQRFDMTSGQCLNTNNGQRCINQDFGGIDYCYESIPLQNANNPANCVSTGLTQQDDGANYSPCKYRTQGSNAIRECPAGTQWDQPSCTCIHSDGCSSQRLTPLQLSTQKKPDPQCRYSGRILFNQIQQVSLNGVDVSQPRVVSQKTTDLSGASQDVFVDHYFTHRGVRFDAPNNQAFFSGLSSYLYDYYYVDNPMFATLAITMGVKFDFSNNYYQAGTTYTLLENMYYSNNGDGSVRDTTTGELLNNRQLQTDTKFCNQATIAIRATYIGLVNGQSTRRNFRFTMEAVGERNPVYNSNFNNQGSARFGYNTGVKAATSTQQQATAEIEIQNQDQVNILYIFDSGVSGRVNVLQSNSNQIRTNTVVLQKNVNDQNTPNQIGQSVGSQLGTNKCGFMIGRNFQGSINGFKVHEGCSNPNGLQPTG